jgi:hypothetical protein
VTKARQARRDFPIVAVTWEDAMSQIVYAATLPDQGHIRVTVGFQVRRDRKRIWLAETVNTDDLCRLCTPHSDLEGSSVTCIPLSLVRSVKVLQR